MFNSGVSDNFDVHLSTKNGLKQAHYLASVVLKNSKSPHKNSIGPTPRLKKWDLAIVTLKEPEMKTFKGGKGTMPD